MEFELNFLAGHWLNIKIGQYFGQGYLGIHNAHALSCEKKYKINIQNLMKLPFQHLTNTVPWTLSKRHICRWIIILALIGKAFWPIILGLGEILWVSMDAQEGDDNSRFLGYGKFCVGYLEILSAFAIQKRQARIFAGGF